MDLNDRRGRLVAVIVEPRGGINLGSIARLMENFGFEELRLVNPLLTKREREVAKRFAMRGLHLIEGAKRYDSLEKAIDGIDLLIATSARGSYETLNVIRHAIPCERLTEIVARQTGTIGTVFGREDKGLSKEEISFCDLLATIETGTSYKTLNISHAAAIIFYFISKGWRDVRAPPSASRPLFDAVVRYFEEVASVAEPREFRRKRSVLAFKRVLSRAILTEKEASLMVGILRRVFELLKELNNRPEVRFSREA